MPVNTVKKGLSLPVPRVRKGKIVYLFYSVQLVPARRFPDFVVDYKKKLSRIALSPAFYFGFSKGKQNKFKIKIYRQSISEVTTTRDMV